jgi:hypothetical protein
MRCVCRKVTVVFEMDVFLTVLTSAAVSHVLSATTKAKDVKAGINPAKRPHETKSEADATKSKLDANKSKAGGAKDATQKAAGGSAAANSDAEAPEDEDQEPQEEAEQVVEVEE